MKDKKVQKLKKEWIKVVIPTEPTDNAHTLNLMNKLHKDSDILDKIRNTKLYDGRFNIVKKSEDYTDLLNIILKDKKLLDKIYLKYFNIDDILCLQSELYNDLRENIIEKEAKEFINLLLTEYTPYTKVDLLTCLDNVEDMEDLKEIFRTDLIYSNRIMNGMMLYPFDFIPRDMEKDLCSQLNLNMTNNLKDYLESEFNKRKEPVTDLTSDILDNIKYTLLQSNTLFNNYFIFPFGVTSNDLKQYQVASMDVNMDLGYKWISSELSYLTYSKVYFYKDIENDLLMIVTKPNPKNKCPGIGTQPVYWFKNGKDFITNKDKYDLISDKLDFLIQYK